MERLQKDGIEHSHFYVQLDQCRKAVDGFSKVHRLGVEIDFFDFGVGSPHEVLAPEKNREHSIGDQMKALNVGVMERLQLYEYTSTPAWSSPPTSASRNGQVCLATPR